MILRVYHVLNTLTVHYLRHITLFQPEYLCTCRQCVSVEKGRSLSSRFTRSRTGRGRCDSPSILSTTYAPSPHILLLCIRFVLLWLAMGLRGHSTEFEPCACVGRDRNNAFGRRDDRQHHRDQTHRLGHPRSHPWLATAATSTCTHTSARDQWHLLVLGTENDDGKPLFRQSRTGRCGGATIAYDQCLSPAPSPYRLQILVHSDHDGVCHLVSQTISVPRSLLSVVYRVPGVYSGESVDPFFITYLLNSSNMSSLRDDQSSYH